MCYCNEDNCNKQDIAVFSVTKESQLGDDGVHNMASRETQFCLNWSGQGTVLNVGSTLEVLDGTCSIQLDDETVRSTTVLATENNTCIECWYIGKLVFNEPVEN